MFFIPTSFEKFEQVRAATRKQEPFPDNKFDFVAYQIIASKCPAQSFMASKPLSENPFTVSVLVSFIRGLLEHPYWLGSGDHVNSSMLLELFQQFGAYVCHHFKLEQSQDFEIMAVENCEFKKFIELETLFEIQLVGIKSVSLKDSAPLESTPEGFPSNDWGIPTCLRLDVRVIQFGAVCCVCQFYVNAQDHRAKI